MLFKHGNNRGQALIISVAVLAALLIMAQLFVTLVMRNLAMDLNASAREISLRLARDCVDYALAQLRRDGGNEEHFSYEWGMNAPLYQEIKDVDDGRVELSVINPYCPKKFKNTGNGRLLFADKVWEANQPYSVGDRIAPYTNNDFMYYYEVETANGNSGGFEPTWPVQDGDTVSDGGLTLRCHKAEYDLRYGFCTYCSQIHPAYVKIVSTGYPYRADTWQSGHDYSVGDVVRPPAANGWIYEVIGDSGASGAIEPDWPTKAGDTVPDGGLTLACRVEVKSTIEAVAVVAPVFNNFLRFIGGDCSFTAVHGIYGESIEKPAPLYVLGDVTWGTGIDLYLDNTNKSTVPGEYYPYSFFQALGRIKGAPMLIHTPAGAYDGTYLFNSKCYFDKAHLPSYTLDTDVIKGMGLAHWLNDGDFDRYKSICYNPDTHMPDLLALPNGEASYTNNTDDTADAGAWEDTTGTGSNWLPHVTVDKDGGSEEVKIYSPPAVELLFTGDKVSIRNRFSLSAVDNAPDLSLPRLIYAEGDVRVRGYLTKPVTVVSNRDIFVDKAFDVTDVDGRRFAPALIARGSVVMNTSQMFYYYAEAAGDTDKGTFDSIDVLNAGGTSILLSDNRLSGGCWTLSNNGEKLVLDLSSSPIDIESNSRLVLRHGTGSGSYMGTVQIKVSYLGRDGNEHPLDTIPIDSEYYSVPGTLQNAKQIIIELVNNNVQNKPSPDSYKLRFAQLFFVPVSCPVQALMAAYTGSLFVIPGKDYYSDGSWDNIWSTPRPADLISLSGSIAEKNLEDVSKWSNSWPATGADRKIKHEYDLDWRDPTTLADNNLPPYLPRLVMLVSWVKK